MTTFLSPAEVEFLTGFKRPSKQITWLKQQHITFFVSAGGHPRVPRSAIDVQRTTIDVLPKAPNWEAMHRGKRSALSN